jgi:putative phosphoesterase
MRVAAIYDIHGNLPALEAVLDDIRRTGVDRVVVGGDVVPGPMPRETLARLLDLDMPVEFLVGNGDRAVAEEMAGLEPGGVPAQFRDLIRHSARELAPEHAQLISSWPKTVRIEMDGLGGVLFCHATPRNDTEIFVRTTTDDRLRPVFEGVTAQLVVCGHTHMQFDRSVGDIRVVNAGSVGMPFQPPGAYWLLLGPDIQLQKTPYDLARAAAIIRATSYPQAEAFAAHNILQPPAEQQMLETFAKVELT